MHWNFQGRYCKKKNAFSNCHPKFSFFDRNIGSVGKISFVLHKPCIQKVVILWEAINKYKLTISFFLAHSSSQEAKKAVDFTAVVYYE